MGLNGTLKQISMQTCPHCRKEYGNHSKKSFIKCLYTANYNLYHLATELNTLKNPQPVEQVVEPVEVEQVEAPTGVEND
jgi:predicted transcriptional regulator